MVTKKMIELLKGAVIEKVEEKDFRQVIDSKSPNVYGTYLLNLYLVNGTHKFLFQLEMIQSQMKDL